MQPTGKIGFSSWTGVVAEAEGARGLESLWCGLGKWEGLYLPGGLGFAALWLGILGILQIVLNLVFLNCKLATFSSNSETYSRCEVRVKGQRSFKKYTATPLCVSSCAGRQQGTNPTDAEDTAKTSPQELSLRQRRELSLRQRRGGRWSQRPGNSSPTLQVLVQLWQLCWVCVCDNIQGLFLSCGHAETTWPGQLINSFRGEFVTIVAGSMAAGKVL